MHSVTETLRSYITEDIIVKILYNLPVKSILRFTSVCKSWNSLIKSPNFIQNHRSCVNDNPQLFLLHFPEDYNYGSQIHLSFDDDNYPIEPTPHITLDRGPYRIAGACNGLICFFNFYFHKVILWNPCIKKFLALPELSIRIPTEFREVVGLGFESHSNDYKVLRMVANNEEKSRVHAEVYSLKANSSKNITRIAPQYCSLRSFMRMAPAFFNGALHWMSFEKTGRYVVMVFDIRRERFREIMLPENLVKFKIDDDFELYAYDNSTIAVIFNCEIWVMKEYGVVGSWVKLPSIEINYNEFYSISHGMWGRLSIVGFKSKTEIILLVAKGPVMLYDLESQCVKMLNVQMEWGYSSFYAYMESLALLDKGNNVKEIDEYGSWVLVMKSEVE